MRTQHSHDLTNKPLSIDTMVMTLGLISHVSPEDFQKLEPERLKRLSPEEIKSLCAEIISHIDPQYLSDILNTDHTNNQRLKDDLTAR